MDADGSPFTQNMQKQEDGKKSGSIVFALFCLLQDNIH